MINLSLKKTSGDFPQIDIFGSGSAEVYSEFRVVRGERIPPAVRKTYERHSYERH